MSSPIPDPADGPDLPEALARRLLAMSEPERRDLFAHLERDSAALRRELDGLMDLSSVDDLQRLLASAASVELDVERDVEMDEVASGHSEQDAAPPVDLHGRDALRYRYHRTVGRGGMGSILECQDLELRRRVAMKVMQAGVAGEGDGAATPPSSVARFLEEAQITGQLDHPGIPPVHEMGLDARGRLFFTMRLVRGETLREVFARVREGQEGWTRARALNLLLRACEAVAFAHSKGVIHRDLKPSNVMVGPFGEVSVMDWGLARVMGREDLHDLGVEPPPDGVRTLRSEERDDTPDSPLLTRDSTVLGTPAYMPPEQARAQEMGPRSDVYSLGAMLYELLTGRAPYLKEGERHDPRVVHLCVLAGPPPRIEERAADAEPELVAICERAMARRVEDRYEDVQGLAEDLRSYLEHRVVQAYRTGALVELRKWVHRNRGLAASLAIIVLLLLASAFTFSWVSERNRRTVTGIAEELRETNTELEGANGHLQRSRQQAEHELARYRQLSDLRRLQQLRREADALWPARPWMVEEMFDWLERAETLVARLDPHRAALDELGPLPEPTELEPSREFQRSERGHDRATLVALLEHASRPETREITASTVEGWRRQLERIEAEARRAQLDARPFEDDPSVHHRSLHALVEGLEELAGPGGLIEEVEQRAARADAIEEQTLARHADAWAEAIESIADSEHYDGFELPEQVGLVPLGPDPRSGLWEFWHVESGDRPRWDAEQGVVPDEPMGIVLVLIPGGSFPIGATRHPTHPQYDPRSNSWSQLEEVQLDRPYFLGKYELTQAQWFRMTGRRPSSYAAGTTVQGTPMREHSPVSNVSWFDCDRTLWRYGLELPTEIQWERAARAGTTTPLWCGDLDSIGAGPRMAGNVLDQQAARRGAPQEMGAAASWDDGASVSAPVGSYRPNPFGLHDVIGNVFEWCRDRFGPYGGPYDPVSGMRWVWEGHAQVHHRMSRGGSHFLPPGYARSSFRDHAEPSSAHDHQGVRAAAAVQGLW